MPGLSVPSLSQIQLPKCLRALLDGEDIDCGRGDDEDDVISPTRSDSLQYATKIPYENKGSVTVRLVKREDSILGLTVVGGVDKGVFPQVAAIRPGGTAHRSDAVLVGDFLLSINGIRTPSLKHDEIISLLRHAGHDLTLELEYSLPPRPQTGAMHLVTKTVQVRLQRESGTSRVDGDVGGFGFTIRGGAVSCNEDPLRCRPLTFMDIRKGGATDRESTIKVGDRLLAVSNVGLRSATLKEALNIVLKVRDAIVLLIEYDCAVMDTVSNAEGAILVEIDKTPGSDLGISLALAYEGISSVIKVDSIQAASMADRSGALTVGDKIISINGVPLEHANLMEAQQHLVMSNGPVRLEVLPTRAKGNITNDDHMKFEYFERDKSIPHHYVSDEDQDLPLPSVSVEGLEAAQQQLAVLSQLTSNLSNQIQLQPLALALQSLTTIAALHQERSSPRDRLATAKSTPTLSMVRKQGNTLRSSERSRREYISPVEDSFQSVSMFSGQSLNRSGQVCRTDTVEVLISPDTHRGLGLSLQAASDNFASTDMLFDSAVIAYLDPGGPADRTGILQVGDRVLKINGYSLNDKTLEQAKQLLREATRFPGSNGCCLLVEYNVTESVVPSSGIFNVTLVKHGGGLGITISSPANRKDGEPLFISDIKKGSIAHRSGTLEPGDKLLAIDGLRLERSTIEEAAHVLQSSDAIVKLTIKKDETYSEESGEERVCFTVELNRNGKALGITVVGSEQPFYPIFISFIEEGSLADICGAMKVGDQILAINGKSLKSRNIEDVKRFLRATGETVNMKIKRSKTLNMYLDDKIEYTDEYNSFSGPDINASQPRTAPATRRQHSMGRDNSRTEHRGQGSSRRVQSRSPPRVLSPGRRRDDAMFLSSEHYSRKSNENKSQKKDKDPEKFSDLPTTSDDDWPIDVHGCNRSSGDGDPNPDGSGTVGRKLIGTFTTSKEGGDVVPDMMTEIEASLSKGNSLRRQQHGGTSRSRGKKKQASKRHFEDICLEKSERRSLPSATPPLMAKVVLRKTSEDNFGFSVSDALFEKGVYVNKIRRNGPADVAGMKRFDKILFVNKLRADDSDCKELLPLFAACEQALELTICRYPLAEEEALVNTKNDLTNEYVHHQSPEINTEETDATENSLKLRIDD